MAYSAIDKSTSFCSTVVFSGTAAGQSITGVGFQPDFVWGKSMLESGNHQLLDSVRGVGKPLESDTDDAEASDPASSLSSFDADGFTLAGGSAFNPSGTNNVASWNWKLGTSTGLDFSAGDITPSAYSINATTGVGIYKYTGPGTVGGDTLAHNLGTTPKLIIVKRLSDDYSWAVQHSDMTSTKILNLNESLAEATNDAFHNTFPTSTLVTLGSSTYTNAAAGSSIYVMYAFAPVKGYSAIGSYAGNANTNGPFVYTGFKPTFVLTKPINYASAWGIHDNKRPGYNPPAASDLSLQPNTSAAQVTEARMDILSNGFKLNSTAGESNGSYNYLYMAFGQPLVSSTNIAATAR